jgi:hypothetical protein
MVSLLALSANDATVLSGIDDTMTEEALTGKGCQRSRDLEVVSGYVFNGR